MEIWKDIPGYDGVYKVSSLGRVLSLHDYRGSGKKYLKIILNSCGYYVVTLYRHGKGAQKFLHRLIAEAFIEKPEGCDVVDHINTITTDNRLSNLRWTTPHGNLNNPISKKRRLDAIRAKACGKYGVESLKHRGCVQMDLDGNVIKVWGCMSDAWRSLGADSGSITKACQGKYKTACGYRWRYL